MQIINLSPSQIKPDPNQPRKSFDEVHIKEMAQSIITEGVINPIEIDKNYVIITGEQRWRAAKVAGLETVPCKILDLPPQERFRRQVIENIHNHTMTDWDTAVALQKLLSLNSNFARRAKLENNQGLNLGITQLSKELGKSDSYIREHLQLLEDSDGIQTAIKDKKITFTHARELRTVPEEYKIAIEKKILAGEFKKADSVRAIGQALKRAPGKANEILVIDYSPYPHNNQVEEVLSKIAPRLIDRLNEGYNTIDELSQLVDSLLKWLKINSPQTVGRVHAFRIVLNFKVLADAINRWGEKTKQIK